jgi:molybdopterin converting factor small subunit
MDNGYGFTFWSDIVIIGDIDKDNYVDITKILVDGRTLGEIEKELEDAQSTCKLWTEKSKCALNEFEDFDDDDYKLANDCNVCLYLNMIRCLAQSLHDGNW